MALYRDRGQIRFGLGNAAGAMEDFTVAIEKDPFDADNHANRGYLKMLQYDFEGAREDVRKGLFWKKEHPRSHYMMGLLHYSTGQYRDAITAIGQARTLGFKGNEGFITKARSHFYLNAHAAAETEATEGLAAFPAVSDLAEIRARARLAQNRTTEALADAEAVIQAAPRSGRAHATRAAVKLAMKDIAGARADIDKAIELDAFLFDGYQIKAEILLAAGDKAGARALYAQSAARTDAKMAHDKTSRNVAAARIVELDAPPPIIVAELGEAELKARCEKREDPLRMQSCDRLVETAATPEAKADRLILRSRARPYEESLADFDLAVASAPGYPPALIARAYRHLGYFGKDSEPMRLAFADADSAVRLARAGSADWRNALIARVAVAQRKGDFAEAVTDLTRIIEADPATIDHIAADRALAFVMAGRPEQALADVAIAERALGATDDFSADLLAQTHAVALIDLGRLVEAQAVLAAWDGKRQSSVGESMRDSMKGRALLLAGADRAAFDLAAKMALPGSTDHAAIAVRGIAASRLGDALAAISDLTSVIDAVLPDADNARYLGFTPGFAADLFLHRGLARAQLRQVSMARADFSEAIKRAPDRARPYAERARLALMADNPAALTDVAMALRIEPAEPRWLALAARIHHATADMAAAERFVDLALAAGANEPDLVLLRAKARLALGKFGPAAEDASARLADTPTDAEAHLVRIEARVAGGNLKAALTEAEAARSATAGDHRILLMMGEVKARSGDAPGAIGAFEDAANRPEAALAANKRLGDLYAGLGSDQLALGYYAKALEARGQGVNDEATKTAARIARDALIRKMAAPK
jgi:tetratricopeptide (TPR) repeat protein